MKIFNIYLAGGMSKFGKENYNESNEWRNTCVYQLERQAYSRFKVQVTNPNWYFNFNDDPPQYESEREIMDFDLHKVRNADLLIVNFNDPASLGTMAEIATAYERRIPIIGLSESMTILHPWQKCMCNRIFTDITEMLTYVEKIYLY